MPDFKVGDRVVTVEDVPPIAANTMGTVKNASGIPLIVKFDGDSSPGRLTPRDAVRKVSKNAAIAGAATAAVAGGALAMATAKMGAKVIAAKKSSSKKAPKKEETPVVWGKPSVTGAARLTASGMSVSTEIENQLVILFNDARVDLQTGGPLAGTWGGSVAFRFSAPVPSDRNVRFDLRGNIDKSADCTSAVLFLVDGTEHPKTFMRGAKAKEFRWRVEQTLRKGALVHTLTLLLAAERRSSEDHVRITVDSIDIVAS